LAPINKKEPANQGTGILCQRWTAKLYLIYNYSISGVKNVRAKAAQDLRAGDDDGKEQEGEMRV